MKILWLWPISGWICWVFCWWYWKLHPLSGFDRSYWLMLFNFAVAGPFSWLILLFEHPRS